MVATKILRLSYYKKHTPTRFLANIQKVTHYIVAFGRGICMGD